MSNPTEFPYVTLLDVLHRPLELIDERRWQMGVLTSGTTKLSAK